MRIGKVSFIGFNLAIEMLIISGSGGSELESGFILFQSRNRDAYHFRLAARSASLAAWAMVSISQSRCLSFQVMKAGVPGFTNFIVSISQSRCLSFQVTETELPNDVIAVSISQSRCLSFQEKTLE